MKLKCVRHAKRVMVFDMGEIVPTIHAVSVVHREDGKRCDSNAIEIGGEYFSPREVIDWDDDSHALPTLPDILYTHSK